MGSRFIIPFLLITNVYAVEVVNVAPGIFSKKVVSDGLKLPVSNTFSPINTLTTTVHLDKSYSVFVFTISLLVIMQIRIFSVNY